MSTNRTIEPPTSETNSPENESSGTLALENRIADKLADPKINNGLLAMHQTRFRIAGDVIAKTVRDLPDDQRAAIRWAEGYCRAKNLSCGDLGQKLQQPNGEPYSESSVYQAFTGRREGASLANFVAAVETLRKRVQETQPQGKGIVETGLTRLIHAHLAKCFERHWLSFVFGESQIGKTTAIADYAKEHNHGETILIRMPTRGSQRDLLEELSIRHNVPMSGNGGTLKRRIIESFDDRNLLIVDECHECLYSRHLDAGLGALNFLREIHDRRGCGVVLVGTGDLRRVLQTNKTLRQLWLRGSAPLQLPKEPSDETLAEFARAHGLAEAEDRSISVEWTGLDASGREVKRRVTANLLKMQRDVIRDAGLGRWLRILEDATEAAREAKGRVTWGRVILAREHWLQLETES